MTTRLRHRLFGMAIAAFLALKALAAAAQPVAAIEASPERGRIDVWKGARIFGPAESTLAPEQAAALAAGPNTQAVDSPTRVFGRGQMPYWAAFSLVNPDSSPQPRLLAVETTTQFEMHLYRRNTQGDWLLLQSVGETAAGRIGEGSLSPVWPIMLAPGESASFLLRIQGPAIVRFPLFAYSPTSFAIQDHVAHVAIGITAMACVLAMMFILTLRRYLNDASVALSICMIAADLIAALWISGFLAECFPGIPEQSLSSAGFAAYAILFGCGCLHARTHLDVSGWSPRLDRILQVLGWIWISLAPWFSQAFPYHARSTLVWGGFAVASIVLATSIMAMRRRIPFTGLIAAAWLAYVGFSATFLVARIAGDALVWSPSVLSLAQATVSAVLFGLAMGQRLMQQRDVLVAERQEALMLRQQEAALAQQRGLAFAATAHDLRQPMVGIGLFSNLIVGADHPDDRSRYAQSLSMALKEMNDLLVGIQQLAKVNQATHQAELETVWLNEILMPIVEDYRQRAAGKSITIRHVESRIAIRTHVPYLQRIVRNLLSNSVRYASHGDRILIGCRRAGGHRLVIMDTGQGMTEAQLEQAFDPFQRFSGRHPVPDGFGLGLFSVKCLADAMGARLSLHSRPGGGTQCHVWFPAGEVMVQE